MPRGLDFLFSRNRLNVAISRAKCLAYLVCSPRLLDANCRTVEQMRLANALCLLVESAAGPCLKRPPVDEMLHSRHRSGQQTRRTFLWLH